MIRFFVVAGVTLTTLAASAVEFNEIARFNVGLAFNADINNDAIADNPQYIGTNPLAIAWNGSKLYLAGFNQGTFPGAGIIEVLNATATGLQTSTAADLSPVISLQNPPFGRGYTGLAIKGNQLAASYDEGAASVNGIQLFDTSTNTKTWDLSVSSTPAGDRAGSGVAFDPGFNGTAGGQGVAWTKFGSGRRALQNAATGATTYGFAAPDTLGMQWLPAISSPNTNFARDMDFDPETGDVYVRRSNDVDKAIRTGDNATTQPTAILVDGTDAVQLGQKLAFLSNTVDGDLIIYNDRPNTASGVPFLTSVKVIDKLGVPQTANFNLIGGLTGADIAAGAQIYDFDFDPVSQTLAVADFFNRNVFIFKVGPIAPPGVVGDYDNNGTVGSGDYTAWSTNFGGASSTLFNVNPTKVGTDVDASDYTVWRDALPAPNVAASAAVPEPATLVLALALVGGGWMIRRR